MAGFAHGIAAAAAVNGLTQAVLHLTTPGVPDLYQGTDLWDLSLVDPDNRRPVDFARRRAMIADQVLPDIRTWRDGAIKQAVIARALALRAQQPELFANGRYVALRTQGPAAQHILAFARQLGGAQAVIAVTRLSTRLLGSRDVPLPPPDAWQDTRVLLPRGWGAGSWQNRLTGASIPARLAASRLFAVLPVAILVPEA